jgi:hypothetical protein
MVLGLALSATAPAWAAQSGESNTPYQDPSAVGRIGLCDKSGHEITSGSVNAKPFASRAVSTAAATSPYGASGRTATLYAFQPRQDVAPGDWSGDQLTATSRYTNAAHPMAQATAKDESLSEYMAEFAPSWDGLLQLRMFLGAPGQATYSYNYPATTIKVTGDTWRVVDPVSVACDSGSATSIESILLPSVSSSAAAHHAAAHQQGKKNSTRQAAGADQQSVSHVSSANVAETGSAGGGHSSAFWAGLGGALVVVAAAGLAGLRSRRTKETK